MVVKLVKALILIVVVLVRRYDVRCDGNDVRVLEMTMNGMNITLYRMLKWLSTM
jgi:hypothetical protein